MDDEKIMKSIVRLVTIMTEGERLNALQKKALAERRFDDAATAIDQHAALLMEMADMLREINKEKV